LLELPAIQEEALKGFTLQLKFQAEKFTRKNAVWENQHWIPGSLHLEFRNGALCFFLYGSDYIYFDYPFVTGETYNLNLVYNSIAKNIKLYINNELVKKKEFGEAVPLNVNEVSYIGGYGNENRFFIGQMDNFKLWNRPLQPAEIDGSEPMGPGLLVSLNFEELDSGNLQGMAGGIDATLIEKDPEMPELPRFGMSMKVAGKFNELTWFGRGFHENYWDRKTSAMVGLYENTVEGEYFPYIRPQENGYKTDTRWLALQDSTGKGLMIIGEPLVSFSALNFTIEDLDQGSKKNYKHTNDLKPNDFISLNVDYKQTGVGGDDSWGARAHSQYTLHYREYEYSYIIRPLRRNTNLMNLSKKRFK